MHVGGVGLLVRDLDRVIAFYRDVIGLRVLSHDEHGARLGIDGTTLVELKYRPDAPPDDERSAGLYHTAFLMPTRSDLARWVLHVARRRVPITGASDHGVSEAFYLDDPEGNGIEVYADRPPETWRWRDGFVSMPTKPLDIENLLSTSDRHSSFASAPAGLRIGHIHLRVGELASAEKFYSSTLGLAPTRQRDGALFMSSGGYHHHIAGNIWHSAGAGLRDLKRAGLAWFSLLADDVPALRARLAAAGVPITVTPSGMQTVDPWGTPLRIAAG